MSLDHVIKAIETGKTDNESVQAAVAGFRSSKRRKIQETPMPRQVLTRGVSAAESGEWLRVSICQSLPQLLRYASMAKDIRKLIWRAPTTRYIPVKTTLGRRGFFSLVALTHEVDTVSVLSKAFLVLNNANATQRTQTEVFF